MTKQRREAQRGNTQGPALITLGGVILLLMISFSNWREIDRIEESLDRRLDQIDSRMTEMTAKLDRPAAAAPSPGVKTFWPWCGPFDPGDGDSNRHRLYVTRARCETH